MWQKMKRTDISAPPTPDPSDKPADTRPETSYVTFARLAPRSFELIKVLGG